jgi:hypothetical protein
MIMYKGKYCPIRQYMPKKPVRFGIKVWAAADALSKYLWDFEVYYGKSGNPHDDGFGNSTLDTAEESTNSTQPPRSGRGEGFNGRNVVKSLMHKLGGRGHIVTTDNYFTSVPLFLDLLQNGTMATSILWWNRKYVPRGIFAKHVTKKKEIGWVDFKMHREGKICCVVWKDKQPVVFLSTHADPVPPPGEQQYVWRKFGGKRKKVHTGPMHLQIHAEHEWC